MPTLDLAYLKRIATNSGSKLIESALNSTLGCGLLRHVGPSCQASELDSWSTIEFRRGKSLSSDSSWSNSRPTSVEFRTNLFGCMTLLRKPESPAGPVPKSDESKPTALWIDVSWLARCTKSRVLK